MRRRELIVLLGCVVVAQSSEGRAQQTKKTYRVGLLTNGNVIGATDERRKHLVSALAAQGVVEGQNIIFQQRSADGLPRRLDGVVNALKEANVDAPATFGYPILLAAN